MHARHDSRAVTANARRVFLDRFEHQVDPDGVLPVAERRRRAEHAKREHMLRLALGAGPPPTRSGRFAVTVRSDKSRSLVDAVTDAAIAALLPADRRLSITVAEHRDRAHVDAAVDRLLPRNRSSDAERERVRHAALDRLALSRSRRVAAARYRGLAKTRRRWCR
ncbi:MAG TPA: hypothetical protein VK923_15180 [Euzebyales bacterium]|nr:hypothetical protein [Euzebyales bacterium]